VPLLLEVTPRASPLAADAALLAGNEEAAADLAKIGVVVDWSWPTVALGGSSGDGPTLAGRPRFELIRDTVNWMTDALPFEVPEWSRPRRRTVLFRADMPVEEDATKLLDVVDEHVGVVGVFQDPPIALAERKWSDDAVGTVRDAAERYGVEALHDRNLRGQGITVVLVDAGINIDYLLQRGRSHRLDPLLSYVRPGEQRKPFAFAPGHGTLAAFQVGIGAPDALLADQAAIGEADSDGDEPPMHAWLSDIAPGYQLVREHLRRREATERTLVISNSWAMLDPDWDFPVIQAELLRGSEQNEPQNFSDNPGHPFNRLVQEVVGLGADVVFAAGNCGQPHPVAACQFGLDSQPICGANSLPEVTTVGAVACDGERLGYSSQGPGRLAYEKPDVCGYSHYEGSGVHHADWGTSTACPAVAGIVAAVRSRWSSADLSPEDLRAAVTRSAQRAAGAGHSPDVGWGVVDAEGLIKDLEARMGDAGAR